MLGRSSFPIMMPVTACNLRICDRLEAARHPAGGCGLWGTQREVPSFLYAMPCSSSRVFLEETCLVAKPALPFATLKRRLHRRIAAMGLKVLSRSLITVWQACSIKPSSGGAGSKANDV